MEKDKVIFEISPKKSVLLAKNIFFAIIILLIAVFFFITVNKLWVKIIVPIVLLIFLVAIFWPRNTKYIITDKKIIIRSSSGSDNAIYYKDIKGVKLQKGISYMFFKTGNILLDTGAVKYVSKKVGSVNVSTPQKVYTKLSAIENPEEVYGRILKELDEVNI